MAVLKVLPYPNPFLRTRARSVEAFDEALEATVKDMTETMAAEDGLGLAATQVGIDARLLLINPYAFKGEEGRGQPDVVIINPEVVWKSEETISAEEGCLSFPGVYIHVTRPKAIKIKAQDVKGEFFEIEAQDLGARALLHEIDHIEGVVMVDHVSHLVRSRALKKHQKLQKEKAMDEAGPQRPGQRKPGAGKPTKKKTRQKRRAR
ncbi:MAG: peptide deformylase [Bradymonadia bacterium]